VGTEKPVERGLLLFGKMPGEFPHLRFRKGPECLHQCNVALDVLDFRHADYGSGYGQRQRVIEQLFDRGIARQRILRENFHSNHAHFLTTRNRKGHRFETGFHGRVRHHAAGAALHSDQGSVERHLRAIEIVAFERGLENRWVSVTGNTDEASHLLVAELHELIEHAAFRFDAGQVVFRSKRMDVNQIHLVHLQCLQACFDDTRCFVAVSI
jgi:hypothetical protein